MTHDVKHDRATASAVRSKRQHAQQKNKKTHCSLALCGCYAHLADAALPACGALAVRGAVALATLEPTRRAPRARARRGRPAHASLSQWVLPIRLIRASGGQRGRVAARAKGCTQGRRACVRVVKPTLRDSCARAQRKQSGSGCLLLTCFDKNVSLDQVVCVPECCYACFVHAYARVWCHVLAHAAHGLLGARRVPVPYARVVPMEDEQKATRST